MDVYKLISCMLCLIICAVSNFIDAQPDWMRSPFGRRGPFGGRGLFRRGFFPNRHAHIPAVVPVSPIVVARRPNIVSDRSDRQDNNVNVENVNNNRHVNENSNNVSVNQVSSNQPDRRRTGSGACGRSCNFGCTLHEQCVYDPLCPSPVCREYGLMI